VGLSTEYRPNGVLAIAIILIIFAVLGLIGAITFELIFVAAEYQNASLIAMVNFMLSLYFGVPLMHALIVNSITLYFAQSNIIYMHVGAVVVIIFSVVYIITAIGLLGMKNWGRYLALIIGILSIIEGVIGLLVLIGIIPLIFGIIVVVYLNGDVKYEFE
jgi:hypothetical protein